jgi:hypothetical protein
MTTFAILVLMVLCWFAGYATRASWENLQIDLALNDAKIKELETHRLGKEIELLNKRISNMEIALMLEGQILSGTENELDLANKQIENIEKQLANCNALIESLEIGISNRDAIIEVLNKEQEGETK